LLSFISAGAASALTAHGGDIRRLFNTAGREYREQKLAGKLDGLTVAAALELLTANGNLVKRPFLVGKGVCLVGFDENAWTVALAARG
jgi:arsenate reductase